MLGAMQSIDVPMKNFDNSEKVDFCIVVVGSAGAVLLQRLSRARFSVVGLEAGAFWDTERDWEAGSHKQYWNELRITGGKHPLTLGANNSGKGVGGGSVHWAAFYTEIASFGLPRLLGGRRRRGLADDLRRRCLSSRIIEEQCPGLLYSILLFGSGGKAPYHRAAPSLPDSYAQALDRIAIGPTAGLFGTAAYPAEPVLWVCMPAF
jgi:hypothetical protein